MDLKTSPKPTKYKIYSESRKEYFEFGTQRQMNIEFMKLLSLAHMCDVEVLKGEELFYNGPSPDEVALVEFAASQNFKCTYNSDDMLKMKAVFNNKHGGETEYKFEVLRKMEFNSDRKRMSVVLRDPNDGKIKLLIKGADSIILDRIDKNQYPQEIQEKI